MKNKTLLILGAILILAVAWKAKSDTDNLFKGGI